MSTRILVGDVRERLAELPNQSVHCVVTSPPYFGLRDYGTAQWDGGDPACDHTGARRNHAEHEKQATSAGTSRDPISRTCRLCGAVRIDSQIGLEPTLADYIANLVAVFREVRRVMRDDATLWLNIGDSYCSHDPGGYRSGEFLNPGGRQSAASNGVRNKAGTFVRGQNGLKPKDLMLVPARLAIALQDDGWYLRSDIIWHKRAPMPESVTDRPTSAHEHIFLLAKQPRYFYDADAVREDQSDVSIRRRERADLREKPGWDAAFMGNPPLRLKRQNLPNRDREAHENFSERWAQLDHDTARGANMRNVWTLSPESFPLAHFAVYPTEIPRRAIKAGTSERGCCAACGVPWKRIIEQERAPRGDAFGVKTNMNGHDHGQAGSAYVAVVSSKTTGWEPSCACGADVVPCTVLDPFLGSGTTLLVADQLGRDGIGIELNPEYARMAEQRIRGAAPMFAQVEML